MTAEGLLVKGLGGRPRTPAAKIEQLQARAAKLKAQIESIEAEISKLQVTND